MKASWKQFTITFAAGVLITAVVLAILMPPRGNPVELLPAPTPGPIFVHISGEVASPGLYELAQGSRVGDLIEVAGGFSFGADDQVTNLAALLEDGMHVDIPPKGQEPAVSIPEMGIPFSDQININLATVDDLVELPGIGNTKAAAIVNYRVEYGDFNAVTDIMNVPGIGSGIFDDIKDLIRVD